MPDEHQRVYVLRLWDESGPGQPHRISLYDATTGERLYFGSLKALLAYLGTRLRDPHAPFAPHLRS